MYRNQDHQTGAAIWIDNKEEVAEPPEVDHNSANVEDNKRLDNYALSEDIQETICLLTPGGELKLECSKTGDSEGNTFKIILRYKSDEVTKGFCLNIDKIDEYWIEALTDLLNNNNVMQIRQLYDETQTNVKILAEALKENTSLTNLSLEWNNIRATGAKALADALKKNASLTSLYLEWNNIGATGAAALAEMLKENTSLTSLNLWGNNIGKTGAEALAEALKGNTSLTSLGLGVSRIGDTEAETLADALKDNTSLTSLNLERNNIGDTGAAALAEMLKDNTSLTSLDLKWNNIGDTGAKAILAALEFNTTLTDIVLSGISDDLSEKIEAALAANRFRKENNIEDSSVTEILEDNTANFPDPDMDIIGDGAIEEHDGIS